MISYFFRLDPDQLSDEEFLLKKEQVYWLGETLKIFEIKK